MTLSVFEQRPRETWYLCDPEKAVDCKKTMCWLNENAVQRACRYTSQLQRAVIDETGRPVLAELDEQGWPV